MVFFPLLISNHSYPRACAVFIPPVSERDESHDVQSTEGFPSRGASVTTGSVQHGDSPIPQLSPQPSTLALESHHPSSPGLSISHSPRLTPPPLSPGSQNPLGADVSPTHQDAAPGLFGPRSPRKATLMVSTSAGTPGLFGPRGPPGLFGPRSPQQTPSSMPGPGAWRQAPKSSILKSGQSRIRASDGVKPKTVTFQTFQSPRKSTLIIREEVKPQVPPPRVRQCLKYTFFIMLITHVK